VIVCKHVKLHCPQTTVQGMLSSCQEMRTQQQDAHERCAAAGPWSELTRVKAQRVGVNLPSALPSVAGLQRHPCPWQAHLLGWRRRCWQREAAQVHCLRTTMIDYKLQTIIEWMLPL
jgi:hypothetical protein